MKLNYDYSANKRRFLAPVVNSDGETVDQIELQPLEVIALTLIDILKEVRKQNCSGPKLPCGL